MMLLQYHLGRMSQGQLTPLMLINEFIKQRQFSEVCVLVSLVTLSAKREEYLGPGGQGLTRYDTFNCTVLEALQRHT